MLLHALGRRMYGEKAGMAAALLTATAFGWVKYARLAMMDAPMALGLALAAYGTWRASEEDDPPWLLAVGVAAAMDFLLKGPVGAVLVLLLSGGFLLVRNRPLLFSRWTAGAFLLGALLGLPWYVASFAVHGQAFYDFFVVTAELRPVHAPLDREGGGDASRRIPRLHAPLDLPLSREPPGISGTGGNRACSCRWPGWPRCSSPSRFPRSSGPTTA